MGTVLTPSDFAAARAVRSASLTELGVAPICMAPGQEDPGHSHTLVEEVVIVQSGEGRIQIENETHDLCAGAVAVVPAGQFHALCNTGTAEFEAVAIYNANVDRKAVVLKNRKSTSPGKRPTRWIRTRSKPNWRSWARRSAACSGNSRRRDRLGADASFEDRRVTIVDVAPIAVAGTGCIALLAMLARVLYLRNADAQGRE